MIKFDKLINTNKFKITKSCKINKNNKEGHKE